MKLAIVLLAGLLTVACGQQKEKKATKNELFADSMAAVQENGMADMPADSLARLARIKPIIEQQKHQLLAQVMLADTLPNGIEFVSMRALRGGNYLCEFHAAFHRYTDMYLLTCDSVGNLLDGMYVGERQTTESELLPGLERATVRCTFLPQDEFVVHAEFGIVAENPTKSNSYTYLARTTIRYGVNEKGIIRLLNTRHNEPKAPDKWTADDAHWVQKIEEIKRIPLSDATLMDEWHAAGKHSDGWVSETLSDEVACLYRRDPARFLQWMYRHPHDKTFIMFLSFSNYIVPKARIMGDINGLKDAQMRKTLSQLIEKEYVEEY